MTLRGSANYLTAPPEWLPGKVIGEAKNGPRYPGRTSSGALNNDGLYARRGFSYTAHTLTTQITPPAGNYSDSVVVDLSF